MVVKPLSALLRILREKSDGDIKVYDGRVELWLQPKEVMDRSGWIYGCWGCFTCGDKVGKGRAGEKRPSVALPNGEQSQAEHDRGDD